MRLLDLLKKSTEHLEKAGIDDAYSDAEMLVLHAAGLDRLDAYVNNPEIARTVSTKTKRFLNRRSEGEPVQYIIGHVDFLGLTIKVGKGVLIPRPETELLAREAIRAVQGLRLTVHGRLQVLDLCTGSGCIALALAKEFPEALVYGTDISEDALSFARANARRNTIKNASFIQGSLFEPVKGIAFDLIISNPPYIRTIDISGLQREIRDWEPVRALDGGRDGLDFYRDILSDAGEYLKGQGFIFLEMGYDQADAVRKIAEKNNYQDISVIEDYAGIGRILKAGEDAQSSHLQG
jgi:release factor glutamine methyltransferase